MRHHEYCREWPNYHPYDCPDCALLNDKHVYTDREIQDIEDQAYQDGKDEAEQEIDDIRSRINDVIMDLENI